MLSGTATRPETARVLLVNAWHDDNRGDSAITVATVGLARRRWPGCRIRVVSLVGGGDPVFASAARHTGAAAPEVEVLGSIAPALPAAGRAPAVWSVVRWLTALLVATARVLAGRPPPATVRALEGVDVVVAIGGSNLFASGRRASAARLLQVLYPLVAAQRRGLPTVALGHTLGPFEGRAARWLARRVLGRTTQVVVRDDDSARVAAELGLSGDRLVLAPDVAFALAPTRTPRVQRLLDSHGLADQPFAALVVRHHPYLGAATADRLVVELAHLAEALVGSAHVERVVVVAHTHGPTPVEDDRPLAGRLHDRIAQSTAPVALVDDDLGPAELAAVYGAARLVVSVRLHGAILALAAGTPAVAVDYFTTKAAGAMAPFGLAHLLQPYERFSADRLVEHLPALLDPRARAGVAVTAGDLAGQLRLVAAALPGPGPKPSLASAGAGAGG